DPDRGLCCGGRIMRNGRGNKPRDTYENSRKQGLKVTVQYRTKHGKVYELTSGAATLAVHISPPEDAADAGPWHVEAHLGVATGPSTVDGWGATPADALRVVASSWTSQLPALATFDWDAVAHELRSVRAI